MRVLGVIPEWPLEVILGCYLLTFQHNHCAAIQAERHTTVFAIVSAVKLEREKRKISVFIGIVLVKPPERWNDISEGPEKTV